MRYNERTGEFEETALERAGGVVGLLRRLVCLPFWWAGKAVCGLWRCLCWIILWVWKIIRWMCKMLLWLVLIIIMIRIIGCVFGG